MPSSDNDNPPVLQTVIDREEILECIINGCRTPRDIADCSGVSKATVNRALRTLISIAAVERTGDGYQPTLLGKILYRSHRGYQQCLNRITESAEALNQLPSDSPLDPVIFVGSDVHIPSYSEPPIPKQEIHSLIEPDAEIRSVFSVVLPAFIDLVDQCISSPSVSGEICFSSQMLNCLSETDREKIDTLDLKTDVEVAEIEWNNLFDLIIIEQKLVVVIYDEKGNVQATIMNANAEAIDWANGLVKTQKRNTS